MGVETRLPRCRSPTTIAFPAHALLIVEERLKEQKAGGVRMPEGMPLDELALRVLIAAALERPGAGRAAALPRADEGR
jgi:hypothetical protein